MPKFVYRCRVCDTFAEYDTIPDPPNRCTATGCRGIMRRVWGAPTIVLKGDGWAGKKRR